MTRMRWRLRHCHLRLPIFFHSLLSSILAVCALILFVAISFVMIFAQLAIVQRKRCESIMSLIENRFLLSFVSHIEVCGSSGIHRYPDPSRVLLTLVRIQPTENFCTSSSKGMVG